MNQLGTDPQGRLDPRTYLISVQERPGRAPAPGHLVIDRVSAKSPAAVAGLAPGDVLRKVDGAPADRVDLDSLPPGPEVELDVYCRSAGSDLVLRARSHVIGVRLQKRFKTLLYEIENYQDDPDDAFWIWELGRWQELRRLAEAGMPQQSGWLAAIVRRIRRTPREATPYFIYLAAALYELDENEKAARMVVEYDTQMARYWTRNYMAICGYYKGLIALERGDRAAAVELLRDAHEDHASERIARKVYELTGEELTEELRWVGRRFPIEYRLRSLDGDRSEEYGRMAGALRAGQLACVCLMAHYRDNGPYSEFMDSYRRNTQLFPNVFSDLHVVTMSEESNGHASWADGENRARAAGVKFSVLLDGTGRVTRTLMPTGAPRPYWIDHTGTIVFEGQIDDVELWDLIGAGWE